MKTLLVVDTSVLSHQVAASDGVTKAFRTDTKYAIGLVKAQLGYIASGEWGGLEEPDVLWALDLRDEKGEYWRHGYLRDYGIAYKANRRKKPEHTVTIIGLVVALLQRKGAGVLGVPGYEADDIAAAAVQSLREYERVITLTTDTDWMGLISPRTIWVASEARHTPQIRHDKATINLWAKKRFKITLEEPRDIWDFKAVNGDVSDNLPPNSPLEVIDLFNPPKRFNLLGNKEFEGVLRDAANKKGKHFKGEKCRKYLRNVGVRPVMLPIAPNLLPLNC